MSRLAHTLRDLGVLGRAPLYNSFRELGWPVIGPMTMSFVVTDKCNSRCATCQIGARYLDDPSIADGELTVPEYDRLASSIGRLEWVTLSGGEPFMRKDFPDLARAIAARCTPRFINVPTNATFVHATSAGVERMLDGFGDTRLILNLSIDGVGAAHDRLRGFDGNFARLGELVARLRRIDDPRLVIGCNTVVSRFNADRARETIDWVLDELRPDSYVVEAAQVRPEYHNAADDPSAEPAAVRAAFAYAIERLRAAERRGVARLVKAFRTHFYQQTLERLERPSSHRCFSAFATCAVMPKGDVWSNTQRAEPMGNVRDFDLDFPALWAGRQARAVRDAIRGDACECESSNVSYPNALLSPGAAARVAWYALRDA